MVGSKGGFQRQGIKRVAHQLEPAASRAAARLRPAPDAGPSAQLPAARQSGPLAHRAMVSATASASASTRVSGSKAPMWNPVTPSFTVSTSPPVLLTSGTVPYCGQRAWGRGRGRVRGADGVGGWKGGGWKSQFPQTRQGAPVATGYRGRETRQPRHTDMAFLSPHGPALLRPQPGKQGAQYLARRAPAWRAAG